MQHDPIQTERLAPDGAGIARAAALLGAGHLVALPTETVYGLGADARDAQAVAQVYAAKGRPSFNPLIVHVADLAGAAQIGEITGKALALARAFWPGPLTLVVPLRAGAGIAGLVTAGLDTVAIRVPALPLAQAVLAAFGGPVAAPSANPSGRISPTTAAHVLDGLDGKIAAVLDGGAADVGLESTIVSHEGVLLRPGGATVEAIEAVIGSVALHQANDGISAPGQLSSHYAPQGQVRLNADRAAPGELWLGFGPEAAGAEYNLSPTGDLTEAAARLFDGLRALDRGGQTIAVSPIPQVGLGVAINDRLKRAAAPR